VRPRVAPSPDLSSSLSACIARRGLKSTRQRQAILGAFLASSGHVTVVDLLARARAADPGVSPATVYRTLRLLAECGLAKPQRFHGSPTMYEIVAGREHHDHLVCTRCGRVVEFEDARIERLQTAVARARGFTVTSHRMRAYGLCRLCRPARPGRKAGSAGRRSRAKRR